jgi:hypothetical protein
VFFCFLLTLLQPLNHTFQVSHLVLPVLGGELLDEVQPPRAAHPVFPSLAGLALHRRVAALLAPLPLPAPVGACDDLVRRREQVDQSLLEEPTLT